MAIGERSVDHGTQNRGRAGTGRAVENNILALGEFCDGALDGGIPADHYAEPILDVETLR